MKPAAELNEMETVELLDELIEHIEKNSWDHIYNNIYKTKDLEGRLRAVTESNYNLKQCLEKIITICKDEL